MKPHLFFCEMMETNDRISLSSISKSDAGSSRSVSTTSSCGIGSHSTLFKVLLPMASSPKLLMASSQKVPTALNNKPEKDPEKDLEKDPEKNPEKDKDNEKDDNPMAQATSNDVAL